MTPGEFQTLRALPFYQRKRRMRSQHAKAIQAIIKKASKKDEFTYFVKCEQFVKIGYSANSPTGRLDTFKTGNPFECSLLGAIRGSREIEYNIHKLLDGIHHRGDWFHATPELTAAISELCEYEDSPYFLWDWHKLYAIKALYIKPDIISPVWKNRKPRGKSLQFGTLPPERLRKP
jgi:hypothetical protein